MPVQRMIPQRAMPRPLPPYNRNPVYHRQPPAAPIHLSGSVLLQSGATDAPPNSAFQNPMGQDMEILEIKFGVSSAPDDPDANAAAFGGSVQCEFTFGSVKITNGAIPLWNFGRAENVAAESLGIGYSVETSNPPAALNFYSMFSWRLPRPLFVPAGTTLVPSLTHTGLIHSPLNVRVGYSARTVFVQPKRVCMPYVASYVGKPFNPISVNGGDSSLPLQLVNNNPEPLIIQRFVGRTLFRSDQAPNPDSHVPKIAENFPQSALASNLTMRIVDSYGRPVVRNFVPWSSVFNSASRSWEMDNGSIMDPGAFYRVDLKLALLTPVLDNNDGSLQTFMSLVGYREVKP